MKEEIIWDFDGFSNKNFLCILTNTGRWRLEEGNVYGKWILTIKPKLRNPCPTFADMLNFMSALVEAEKRNDEFIFSNGNKRTPIKDLRLNDFEEFFVKLRKNYGK